MHRLRHRAAVLILSLAIVLIAALLAGRAAEAVRVPAVVGEIVAGLVVGPTLLHLVSPSAELAFLAELGVLVLMCQVGLELETTELRAVGTPAVRVALIGVVVPLVTGWAAGIALGVDGATSLFLGATLVATSVGVTARTFGDLGTLDSTEARIVLGAAVVDDVLGLLVLSVVLRVATDGHVDVVGTLVALVVAVGFLAGSVAIGIRVLPRAFAWIGRRAGDGPVVLVAAMILVLCLSEGAARAGLAALIGALVAGILIARTDQAERVGRGLAPIAGLLVPVFFVSVGLDVDLGALGSTRAVVLAGVLLGVGVLGKLLSGAGVGRAPGADRWIVGSGMVPRGEVGLAFAATGLAAGVLDEQRYSAVIVVVLATTVIAPVLLRRRLRSHERAKRARD
ncbi:MAG: cation:proton antiporter [Actinobacteria bacterium]|nr:cation:proton antiporter [Actinomycetota bacterium]